MSARPLGTVTKTFSSRFPFHKGNCTTHQKSSTNIFNSSLKGYSNYYLSQNKTKTLVASRQTNILKYLQEQKHSNQTIVFLSSFVFIKCNRILHGNTTILCKIRLNIAAIIDCTAVRAFLFPHLSIRCLTWFRGKGQIPGCQFPTGTLCSFQPLLGYLEQSHH